MILYEIHTWPWLGGLSRKHGRTITLDCVPAEEWDALRSLGANAVWLMGVWERSPQGRAIARQIPELLEEYRRALPDFTIDDVVGSPYCVRDYRVDPHLGGEEGLAAARRELAARDMRLILDFVPNHTAPDHPWVAAHPEYYIPREDGGGPAHGRDPYFPPWTDTCQLNAFHPGLRQAAAGTLEGIAARCDGVRCDMAMLLLNSVFPRTWGERAGAVPETEYWRDVIEAVRARHPTFLFLAEAYWDLEWELQQQGFDYCYDKRLYDRLIHAPAGSIRQHLAAELSYQRRLLRFLENHDETRAATAFPGARARAAAVVSFTLPGGILLHDGQLEGRLVRLPVQLGRYPEEPVDEAARAFYRKLIAEVSHPPFRKGDFALCQAHGWPDNASSENLAAWSRCEGVDRALVVVNFSANRSQGLLRIPWEDLSAYTWRLYDVFQAATYHRNGLEMREVGLYVDLEPWGVHLFRCTH